MYFFFCHVTEPLWYIYIYALTQVAAQDLLTVKLKAFMETEMGFLYEL